MKSIRRLDEIFILTWICYNTGMCILKKVLPLAGIIMHQEHEGYLRVELIIREVEGNNIQRWS